MATEAHLLQGWESHILKLVHRALKYVIPSLVQGGLGYRPNARLNEHSPLYTKVFIYKISQIDIISE